MENIYDEDRNPVYPDYIKTIVGGQFAIGFKYRNGYRRDLTEDKHISFDILSEDDGNWFIQSGASSFWLNDLKKIIDEAVDHAEKNFPKTKWGYGEND
jgi:hypothetical protein